MSAPCVSVVMPVRDGGRWLGRAARSILEQSVNDLELVIVDDGSVDSTPAVIRSLREHDDRVVALRAERPLGIVHALNEGCRVARGRYLARMDADDVSLPGRLERQVRALESAPDVGVLGGQMICTDLTGAVSWPAVYPTGDVAIRRMLPSANPFGHPAVIMRREAFEAAGGYRDACRHAEDYDLWVRLLDRCGGANLAEPVVSYTVHTGQTAFRDWRQHCLSTLAVQASVPIRRAQRGDPLASIERVSEATVRELGVSESEIGARLVESLLSLSNLAEWIGDRSERARLLAEANAQARSTRLPRATTARLALVSGMAAFEDGDRMRALASVARAARAQPRATARLTRDAVRRRRTRIGESAERRSAGVPDRKFVA